jgi:hypothetical protein
MGAQPQEGRDRTLLLSSRECTVYIDAWKMEPEGDGRVKISLVVSYEVRSRIPQKLLRKHGENFTIGGDQSFDLIGRPKGELRFYFFADSKDTSSYFSVLSGDILLDGKLSQTRVRFPLRRAPLSP